MSLPQPRHQRDLAKRIRHIPFCNPSPLVFSESLYTVHISDTFAAIANKIDYKIRKSGKTHGTIRVRLNYLPVDILDILQKKGYKVERCNIDLLFTELTYYAISW